MSDRRWILNRKCFAALRAIGDGTDKRWNYIHVGPKGVTCTDTVSLIRISTPVPGDSKKVITGTNTPTPETANDGHFKLPVYEGRKFREVEE